MLLLRSPPLGEVPPLVDDSREGGFWFAEPPAGAAVAPAAFAFESGPLALFLPASGDLSRGGSTPPFPLCENILVRRVVRPGFFVAVGGIAAGGKTPLASSAMVEVALVRFDSAERLEEAESVGERADSAAFLAYACSAAEVVLIVKFSSGIICAREEAGCE